MFHRSSMFAITSLAVLSCFAANGARAQIPANKTCVAETEKQQWLRDPGGRHQPFLTARATFELFETTLPGLPWSDFAPIDTKPDHQAAAEALKEDVKTTIFGARGIYENILSRIVAARKEACDVCAGVKRYQLQAEPITKAEIHAYDGVTKISLKRLTLREVKHLPISMQLGKMFEAVAKIKQFTDMLKEVGEFSELGVQYKEIIETNKNMLKSNWRDYLAESQNLGTDTNPIYLDQALHGPDINKKYDCRDR